MISIRGATGLAGLLLIGLALSGCTTTGGGFASSGVNSPPPQLPPVASSSVESQALPPIGATGSVGAQDQTTTAQNGFPAPDPNQSEMPGPDGTGQVGDTASADGSFVTLNDVGGTPNTTGRDLNGPLTIEKLLGGWTVINGSEQCRLNLTYTAKADTGRYRASAPGCAIQTLQAVASWQLAGNQVQLFNESGDMIAALLQSGNRFVGTMVGGQSISMAG
ncbi:MAG TPA: AprI/Inh family metalloprotease inhibitor [Devosiaceae bacterium]